MTNKEISKIPNGYAGTSKTGSLYEKDPRFYCDYFKFNLQRGYTFNQVCESIGIDRTTGLSWQNKYSDFDLAVIEGKQPQVEVAENKLLQLVNGFHYVEKKKEIIELANGERNIKTTETTRFVPPSVVAIKFLLVNMRRDKWLSESRVEAQQDLLTMLENASEKELEAVKQALIQAKQNKAIDIKATDGKDK